MSGSDPMSQVCERCGLPHRRCKGHNKAGKPCGHQPIRGGVVCVLHGGSAPQVIAKAEERLRELIHPAISRLAELIDQKEFPSVAIAAVKDALDRNGSLGKAKETQDLHVTGAVDIVSLLRKRHERHKPKPD